MPTFKLCFLLLLATPIIMSCTVVNHNNKSRLTKRAIFDLGCSADQLQYTPLDKNIAGVTTSYGVIGCQRKGVYVMARNGSWILNSQKN